MRFLLLTQYFPPDGGASSLRLSALANELVRNGHDVEVITCFPHYQVGCADFGRPRSFYHTEHQQHITIRRIRPLVATGVGFKRLVSYLWFAAMSGFPLMRATRPDYVFVDSPPLFTAIPGIIAGWCFRAEVILSVADLWPDSVRAIGAIEQPALLRIGEALETWSYKRAAKITAVTKGIAATLTKDKGVDYRKLLYMPNGVDTDVFCPRSPDEDLQKVLGLNGRVVIL